MQVVDYTAMGGIIVVALGLIEVLKVMINRFVPGGNNKQNGNLTKIENTVYSTSDMIKKISKESEKLSELHNVRDEDGVPVWYVRRSMDESLKQLGSAIGNLNNLLMKMNDSHVELRKSVDKMSEGVKEMTIRQVTHFKSMENQK